MLEMLVLLAKSIKTALCYTLYGSGKVGNVLVTCIAALLHHLSRLVENLTTFFSVLGQSFSIFFQDNLQFLQDLLSFAATGFGSIYSTVYYVISEMAKLVSSAANLVLCSRVALSDLLTTTWTAWVQLVVFLKKMLILFGSGVWFLLTLVPLFLFYTCKIFVTLILTIYNELISICFGILSYVVCQVKNVKLSVCDVPLKSLAGLFFAITVALIVRQTYPSIAFYVRKMARALRSWYRIRLVNVPSNSNNDPNRLEATRVLRSTTRQTANNDKQPRATASPRRDAENDCIICQANPKCVLLLPCRHVCLCEDCLKRLRMYNKTCPICRTGFNRTMKIYI